MAATRPPLPGREIPAAEQREGLPRLSVGAAHCGGGNASRASSASPTRSASDDDGCAQAPPSSRGVEEHRVDPALRAALERLDAVRQNQPVMDDFALENYLGHRRAPPPQQPAAVAPAVIAADRGARPSFPFPCFSTDLLMAVARSVPQRDTWAPTWPAPTSRSTSPGSTQMSAFSSSVASSAASSAQREALLELEDPAPPPGRPPRRPGRPRGHSARGRRAQAAGEVAGVDKSGSSTAR